MSSATLKSSRYLLRRALQLWPDRAAQFWCAYAKAVEREFLGEDRLCDCGHPKSQHSVNNGCITFCIVKGCDCGMFVIEINRLRRELDKG